MIISRLDCFEDLQLDASLMEVFRHLRLVDFDSVENGTHELLDSVNMIVFDYDTKSLKDSQAESHRIFIDVHFIISGREHVGFAAVCGDHDIEKEYDADSDSILYSRVEDESTVLMEPGHIAVFYPSDVHRPCCAAGSVCKVRKAVLKVPV